MRRRAWLSAALVAGYMAAAGTLVVAAEKKTDQADIWSDRFTFNWRTNVWEFSGNCRVDIKGPDQAQLTAPKMAGKLGPKGTTVVEITATGPVRFQVTTQPDADGIQRKITAACAGEAVYKGATRTVTLTGGAQAEMTSLPADPNVGPTKFSAEKLTINLKSFTVEGDNIHIEAEIPSE